MKYAFTRICHILVSQLIGVACTSQLSDFGLAYHFVPLDCQIQSPPRFGFEEEEFPEFDQLVHSMVDYLERPAEPECVLEHESSPEPVAVSDALDVPAESVPSAATVLSKPWAKDVSMAETRAVLAEAQTVLTRLTSTTPAHKHRVKHAKMVHAVQRRITAISKYISVHELYTALDAQVSASRLAIEQVISRTALEEGVREEDMKMVITQFSKCQDVTKTIRTQQVQDSKTHNFTDLVRRAFQVQEDYFHLLAFDHESMDKKYFTNFPNIFRMGKLLLRDLHSFEKEVFTSGQAESTQTRQLQREVTILQTLLDGFLRCRQSSIRDNLVVNLLKALLSIFKASLDNISIVFQFQPTPSIEQWQQSLAGSKEDLDAVLERRSTIEFKLGNAVKLRYSLLHAQVHLREMLHALRPNAEIYALIALRVQQTERLAQLLAGISQDQVRDDVVILIEAAVSRIQCDRTSLRQRLEDAADLTQLKGALNKLEADFIHLRLIALYAAALPEDARSNFFDKFHTASDNLKLARIIYQVKIARSFHPLI